jgi:AraC-like DNA-binding protein
MSSLPVLLESWSFSATEPTHSIVLPDGCRDLIFRNVVGIDQRCFISDLATSAYAVECELGSTFVGYRFHPGVVINDSALLRAISSRHTLEDADLRCAIFDHVRLDERVKAALASLAVHSKVSKAAHAEGVCERTLERLVRRQTGWPPSYWKCLARVRRAARSLTHPARDNSTLAQSLAELAADHHFADQAHLSREFRRWFGVTPAQYRASPELRRTVASSGYS